MKPIYSTIPIELCRFALLNRKTNYLKLFIYLKHISNGEISMDSKQFKTWAGELDMSEKWVRTAFIYFIKNKWLWVNGKRKVYKIKSYRALCLKYYLNPKLSVTYEPEDFSNFTSFCSAVVLTNEMKKKGWRDKKRRSALQMERAITNSHFCPKGFYTMPVRYFAKCLGISESTSNHYKQSAIKSGHIEIKRQLVIQTDKNGNKISKDNISVFNFIDSEIRGSLRQGKQYLKKVESDLISSNLLIKRKSYNTRKKSKRY